MLCDLPGILKSACPEFVPALPKRKQSAIARLGFGLLNKIILHYDTAWWAKDGESHLDRWIELLSDRNATFPELKAAPTKANGHANGHINGHANGQIKGNPMGEDEAIQALLQDYLHLQDYSSIHDHAVLMAFVPPPLAEYMESVTPESEAKLFALLHKRLEKALLPVGQKAPEPRHAILTRWRSDPHALGSYTYIPPKNERVGQLASASSWDLVELAQPLWSDTLRFAGEATHRDWFASVHGAWATGQHEGEQLATMHDLRLNPKSSATTMVP